MFMEERHQSILAILQEKGSITISEVAGTFGVSDESARRDLRLLEGKGLCKRTHGGAILPQKVGARPPADRNYDEMPIFPTYRKIARAAVMEIGTGDTLYLCGGSFGAILMEFLPRDIDFTVVTNTVDVAQRLRKFSNIETYMVGGQDASQRIGCGQLCCFVCKKSSL